MGEERGSIAFFSTYRPPVPLDIFASPINPESDEEEFLLTDGKSYNYNGREIPAGALKTLLKYTRMGDRANWRDVDNGDVTGLVFVSERTSNLETLHFALRFQNRRRRVKVYNFRELYNTDIKIDVRMEDSGCFAGNRYFIFVSTHQSNETKRQPWNAVYRTNLTDGETIRLTPYGVTDFSPTVSPSGRKIAVATLEVKPGGWDGEVEDLETDIAIIDVENPENRVYALKNGGWPSWGSNDVIFFHRAQLKPSPPNVNAIFYNWGVFRAYVGDEFVEEEDAERVTPENVDAMTPAAIDTYRVAVAIIREKLDVAASRDRPQHYRHIAVFDTRRDRPLPVTRRTNNYADHYNPFVIKHNSTSQVLIGYNRIIGEELERGEVVDQIDKLEGDDPDEVGVVRVPGVFPTFTRDGTKLAFVDNDFQNVYLVDIECQDPPRSIFSVSDLQLPENERSLFSPVWNQDDEKDILYVCVGPAFSADKQVHIYAIFNASDDARRRWRKLTNDRSNNAFPSTDPHGNVLVFRSTRDWVGKSYKSAVRPKNLYIMDAHNGDRGRVTRLTSGDWIDTHCQWSPNGNDWIVYSSTRGKPDDAPDLDNGLDPGYYSIYLIRADTPKMKPVRVIRSCRNGAGHVNHPMFSPEGDSLVFASDIAGVSVEPISLPLFIHSVRPYGDIFRVDLDDTDDIGANKDLTNYIRVTHSRYENSTPHWTCLSTDSLSNEWRELFRQCEQVTWSCPFSGGSWKTNAALSGQLGLFKRCC